MPTKYFGADPYIIGPHMARMRSEPMPWAESVFEAIPVSLQSPTPLPTTSSTLDLLAEAEAIHEAAGMQFSAAFDYFFTYGYVFKSPTYFMMGEEATHPEYGPLWLIWYAGYRGNAGLLEFFRLMPYPLPYIAFSRAFSKDPAKLRVYDTEKLRRRLEHE